MDNEPFEPSTGNFCRCAGATHTLTIVLHGFTCFDRCRKEVVGAILAHGDSDVWQPRLAIDLRSTFVAADTIVSEVADQVDKLWSSGQYTEVRIVGHSMGGLIARALVVEGARRVSNRSLIGHWTVNIKRLVLVAGINRGWKLSHHLSLLNYLFFAIGAIAGHLACILGKKPTSFDMRQGAPFVSRLRMNWLKFSPFLESLSVVQLLGTIDDMVSPEDNLDFATGSNFQYLEVPNSGHASVITMMPESDYTDAEKQFCQTRRDCFLAALTVDDLSTHPMKVEPWDLRGIEKLKAEGKDVLHVVFVIHGIRDNGYWTDKIARRVISAAERNPTMFNKVQKVTSSYGFFGMGPFLLPWVRKNKVEWLVDQYIQAKAKWPNADFSFVGHSNGTYLLARALEDYPDLKFSNVVLAGSVVRRDYDWMSRLATAEQDDQTSTHQVQRVLNFVASSDWVVGIFPHFFEIFRVQDLGSAGYSGFDQSRHTDRFKRISYAKGTHGAALQEQLWDGIAEFTVTGEFPEFEKPTEKQAIVAKRNSLASVVILGLSFLNPLIWLVLILLIFVRLPYFFLFEWGPSFKALQEYSAYDRVLGAANHLALGLACVAGYLLVTRMLSKANLRTYFWILVFGATIYGLHCFNFIIPTAIPAWPALADLGPAFLVVYIIFVKWVLVRI